MDLNNWFKTKIELLEHSDDPKDIRLMLDLLRARSQLKIAENVIQSQNLDNMSEEELLKLLKDQ